MNQLSGRPLATRLENVRQGKTMTRKIVATEYISLIEDPVGMENSGLGNWTGPFSRGPDGDAFKLDELKTADILIFGRRTYDAFAAAWPNMKDEAGFADRMNALPKIVATRPPIPHGARRKCGKATSPQQRRLSGSRAMGSR